MTKEKKTKIEIPKKELHEIPKGHTPHKSGAGHHDSRPRKERTRKDRNKKAIDRSIKGE